MMTRHSLVAQFAALVAALWMAGAAVADTLTLTKAGSGSGTVTSNIGSINCGATCADNYENNTSITLSASAAPGSEFTGWLGPCTGTGTCQFTINGNTTATATFAT